MFRLQIVLLCGALHCGCLFAQQSSTPSQNSSSEPARRRASPDSGSIINGGYQNNYFQFSCKLPFGWVDRTSDMRDDVETGKSKVLLAIFERPPAASGETINSAVVIAAESADSYPGLKSAADYFGPLTELTESKGFKVVNEPYEFPVDGRPLVRGDFSKERGKLEMLQASLVTLEKGYVLSFTFLGGSQDELSDLIANLTFARGKQPRQKLDDKK